MALEKKNITIPLGGRLDESIDPKLLDKGAMARSRDVLFLKHGAVTKAPGCAPITFALPRANVDIFNAFALESVKDGDRELLLAGGYLADASGYSYLGEGHQMVTLDEQKDILRPCGHWPPITQSNKIVVYSESGNAKDPCVARLGGYMWHVWIEMYAASLTTVFLTVIEEATGTIVLERRALMASNKSQPHIVAVGTDALHVFASDDAGNGLWRVILDPADPTNPGSEGLAYNMDAYPIFDICALVDPTYGDVSCAVFRDSSGNLRGITMDAAGVKRDVILAATGSYDPLYAVTCARVEDKTSGDVGTFLAYAFQNDITTSGSVMYGMISEDLATPHISNVPVLSLAGYEVNQLTLAEEPADAWERGAAYSAIRIWADATQISSGYRRVRSVRALFVAPGGRDQSEDVSWYHYRLQSKAFYYKGRSHCWLRHSPFAVAGFFPPSGVLASYREGQSAGSITRPPMTEAFNFLNALQNRANQGLPDVVSVSVYEFLWTTLRQEFAGAKTIRTATVDYWVKGLRPASLDLDLLFGGGLIRCYDGKLQDHAFLHPPMSIGVTRATGDGELTPESMYQWVFIYEWTDRNGLWHASAPSIPRETTLTGTENEVSLRIQTLCAGEWYRNSQYVRIVIYRTLAGGSEFHYEGYIDNDPGVFYVDYWSRASDVSIEDNRLPYADGSAGSELDNTCPPPMTQLCRHQDRILGISEEDPCDVWFTKPKREGIAPEFSIYQKKRLPVPVAGIASLGDYWIALAEDRIYAVAGGGPDVFGSSGEFLQPRLISSGVGLSNPRCLEETDLGVIFQSERGLELLTPGLQLTPISSPVEDEFIGYPIVRCLPDAVNSRIYFPGMDNDGKMVVFDYKHDRWTTLSARGVQQRDAVFYKGDLHTIHNDGTIRKAAGYKIDGPSGPGFVSMSLEPPWIRMANLTGFQRIWWITILGEWISSHILRVKMYLDYDAETVVETRDFTCPSKATSYPYNLRWKPARQKCAAIKLVIEDVAVPNLDTPGRACDLVAVELTCGFKGHWNRRNTNRGG